jgi:hypothetical protein
VVGVVNNKEKIMTSDKPPQQQQAVSDGSINNHRPSISVRLIRHAESYNNQVYRNARYIYRGGTPDFDSNGWNTYVDAHRLADPGLSDVGQRQATKLAQNYLLQHVSNQVSQPLTIITSPMRRTLATIRPTLHGLLQEQQEQQKGNGRAHEVNVLVHGFYFESEGCHIRDVAQEGMNPQQIRKFLLSDEDDNDEDSDDDENDDTHHNHHNVSFVGFPEEDPNRGWYSHGTGAESRAASEMRAAKFYVWLCEYLDEQLLQASSTRRNSSSHANEEGDAVSQQQQQQQHRASDQQHHEHHHDDDDVFDAGVSILPGEEMEVDHDKLAPRRRKRRTVLLMGHGDFMSLVLKRIVAGFGHHVEHDGVPHRSAFVHYNTGMTELEYFGHGRFLIMSHNAIPHLQHPPTRWSLSAVGEHVETEDEDYASLRTGGSLKDGWSYLMPDDEFVLDGEVAVAFSDEQLQENEHVREQTVALKSLYHLASQASLFDVDPESAKKKKGDESDAFVVEQQEDASDLVQDEEQNDKPSHNVHFIVQRGLQVVGVATYCEQSGIVSDVAVRPSGGKKATETLLRAVKDHAQRKLGRSGSLLVQPRINNVGSSHVGAGGETAAAAGNVMNQQLLDELGFELVASGVPPK